MLCSVVVLGSAPKAREERMERRMIGFEMAGNVRILPFLL